MSGLISAEESFLAGQITRERFVEIVKRDEKALLAAVERDAREAETRHQFELDDAVDDARRMTQLVMLGSAGVVVVMIVFLAIR